MDDTKSLLKRLVEAVDRVAKGLGEMPNSFTNSFVTSGVQKMPNTYAVITLDTSTTGEQRVDLVQKLGTACTTASLISAGGGVSVRFDNEDYYSAPTGTSWANEEHRTLYWKGAGVAGTATLRLGGRIGSR